MLHRSAKLQIHMHRSHGLLTKGKNRESHITTLWYFRHAVVMLQAHCTIIRRCVWVDRRRKKEPFKSTEITERESQSPNTMVQWLHSKINRAKYKCVRICSKTSGKHFNIKYTTKFSVANGIQIDKRNRGECANVGTNTDPAHTHTQIYRLTGLGGSTQEQYVHRYVWYTVNFCIRCTNTRQKCVCLGAYIKHCIKCHTNTSISSSAHFLAVEYNINIIQFERCESFVGGYSSSTAIRIDFVTTDRPILQCQTNRHRAKEATSYLALSFVRSSRPSMSMRIPQWLKMCTEQTTL